MTNKIYRTAMGKSVDLGTMMLQNEHVRAVGNMKVNARGDKLDNANQVVETRAERIQRENNSTSTNVSHGPVQTSSRRARPDTPAPVVEEPAPVTPTITATPPSLVPEKPKAILPKAPEVDLKSPVRPTKSPVTAPTDENIQPTQGGLAEAIARSREIKQELEKTRRQKAQDQGVRKI